MHPGSSDQGEHLGSFDGNSHRSKELGMELAGPDLPKFSPAYVQHCAQLGSGRLHCSTLCFTRLTSPDTCTVFCLPPHITHLCLVQCFTCILLPRIVYMSVKLPGNVVPVFQLGIAIWFNFHPGKIKILLSFSDILWDLSEVVLHFLWHIKCMGLSQGFYAGCT